jgi:hypothetical protein
MRSDSLRRLFLCTVIVVLALASKPAHTYVLNGSWATSQVGFYVNPANSDMSASDAIGSVKDAAAAWGLQSDALITAYYLGTTTGTTVGNNRRNEIMFRSTTNGSAAATTYTYYSSGHIVDADVVVWDGGFKFFPGSSGCSGGVYLQDIATHEFGHVLGLAHTSVSGATMYPTIGYCSTIMRSLAADDVNGIEALYPATSTTTSGSTSGTGGTTTTTTLSLSASGSKVRGLEQASLAWNGATLSTVDVYRNNSKIATVANTGSMTDRLGTRGSGSYTYKVCNAGTTTCSNSSSVVF